MTVDVARRTRSRARKATVPLPEPEPMLAPAQSLAIGEIDQTVFDCPSCSRPLALGARRCPGCRTRLLNGVTLGKASTFVAAGLAVGLLIGGGGGLAFGLANAAAAPAVVAGAPSQKPGASHGAGSAGPTATATSTPTSAPTATPPSGIPPVTRSALVQVVAANGRLATAGAELREALAARSFDASAVAQTLRTISADSVFGSQLAGRVALWPDAIPLGTQLGVYYDAIHDTAVGGLDNSVRNVAAYRSAATAMVALLDQLTDVDAAVRATAASGGVDLGAPAAP
jgi:hypothetical protein